MNNNSKPQTEIKLAELKRSLPVLLLAPYTRIIFLAGSVAANTATEESDIDLVVVSKNKKIWLNKFFLEMITRIFRIKRTKNRTRNKICFNMFLSDKNPFLPHRDSIGADCYKNLQPVWGETKETEIFWKKNLWIKKFCDSKITTENIFGDSKKIFLAPQKTLEFVLTVTGLGTVLEKIFFIIQYQYLKKKFDRLVLDKNSADYDFFLTPHLIAYHFPISNYALKLREYEKKQAYSAIVEKTTQKPL
ncbi:MAG: nucleotidyltransferase domain-containing protein [Parcubacteria group bacterium]|nr:nucleotidyltransferase domain-containing protein [Parcubacteria group bacterium]